MLKKGNRFVYLFIYLFIYACSNQDEYQIKARWYVSHNFKYYDREYHVINDSVKMCVDSLLEEYLHIYGQDWQIDSLLCFNSKRDKFVTTINNSTGACKVGVSDAINKIIGKKINGKWYFLQSVNLVVPRDMYGKDSMHPLTFHELSQIARKEMLSAGLKKNFKGEYIVDDDWVDEHFYNSGWGKFKDTAQYDSVHWHYIMDKWKHKIDANEYKPLRRKKKNKPS